MIGKDELQAAKSLFDIRNEQNAFLDGIDWFVNNLWHDSKEEPLKNKPLLVLYKKDGITYHSTYSNREAEEWNKLKNICITQWCYIEDLLDRKWVTE